MGICWAIASVILISTAVAVNVEHSGWPNSDQTTRFTKIYLFNCTNARDVMDNQAKPLLKQVGPYTFLEERAKTNVSYNSDYTVEYRQKKSWFFEPSQSSGSLDDEIFTVNMVAYTMAEFTRYPGHFGEQDYPFMRGMTDMAIKLCNEELFIKVRVGNLTFDGVDSELLHLADIGDELGGALRPPFERFGWFYARNGSETSDGLFEVFTGQDDLSKSGQISRWNDDPSLGDFFPEPCDLLEGSVGDIFPPKQDLTPVSFFSPDLCRPIHFNFKQETQVDGVAGYKYQVEEEVMANGTFNENNICFNPNPDLLVDIPVDCLTADHCTSDPPVIHPLEGAVNMYLPNGLLNVTTCTYSKYASPTYVSHPHFYLADPLLLDQFHPDSDLIPNEGQHSSYLILHPETGTPLEIAIRTQINVLYRPFTGFPIDMFANTTPTFYPAIWFETITEQPEDFSPPPPSSSTIPSPTAGPGCFDVPLKFNIESSNFAESKLVCYQSRDGGAAIERLPDDETMVNPGTSCVFMSSGHLDSGFVVELFCDVDHWVVNLS